MSLLPSANTCCQSCVGSSITLEELLEILGLSGGCTKSGDGPPIIAATVGCHYWDFTNKRLYVGDDVGGVPTWREIIG
jgi:hypothetical protein